MITESGTGAGSEEGKRREMIIMRVAKLCKRQGQFAIACQKYTQIGQKAKAMKCLVKQGDVAAIVAYANTARVPEVYVLAGNYLQNTNWHANPQTMKTIITLYNKAKAFENLAAFFEACAQMEIDEFREYDKALTAMNEAVNAIKKVPSAEKSGRRGQLEQRMKLISDFVRARSLIQSNPEEMIKICNFIIESPDAESAVRVGDVIAQLVELFYANKDAKRAFEYIQKMIARKIRINPYLDQELIDNVYVAVGMPPPSAAAAGQEGATEEIGEDINENS